MRKKYLLNHLYVIILSILLHSSCCNSRVVKSMHRLVGSQNVGNGDQQAVHQQLTQSIADQKTLHSVQRRQLNNKQIQHGAYLEPIRRQRDSEEFASGRYRNPSVKQRSAADSSQVDEADDELTSSSANCHSHSMGGKLSSSRKADYEEKKLNAKADQDDSSEKLSADASRAVSLHEGHSSALLSLQPESNERLHSVNSEANPQISSLKIKREVHRHQRKSSKVARDKLDCRENKGHFARSKDASRKSEAVKDNSDALAGQGKNIAVGGDNDEAAIAKRIVGGEPAAYENETEDDSSGSETEPVYKRNDVGHPLISTSDSDKSTLESKNVVKRDTVGEDEYDDEDQGNFAGGANLVDTGNSAMSNEGNKRKDARMKRDEGDRNAISKEMEREEKSVDSKREISLNDLGGNEDETIESKIIAEEETAREEGDTNSQQVKSDNVEEIVNARQEENLNTKNDEFDADYEHRIEQQIQQKIDSIKEEIKREVEKKQKIQEIEENNAKYDQLQSKEDENEEDQSLDFQSTHKGISKRALQQNPQKKARGRRRVLKRVKRTTNVQQLNEIEGVEKLDSNVYEKARLRHESIRKRSAPIYGLADKETGDPAELLLKKRGTRKSALVNNAQKRNIQNSKTKSAIIIPEQAHAKIQDELPSDLALDRNLQLAGSSNDNSYRVKRRSERYARRRRGNAVVPEGKVAFLGYRAQDDDENDEGNEFDDDGFEDRTSNLHGKSYADPYTGQAQYQEIDGKGNEPGNFLFAKREQNGYSVRRKRGESSCENDEQASFVQQVALKGGGSAQHHRAHAKAKRNKTTRARRPDTDKHRSKRFLGSAGDSKTGSVASLVSSSQELSPQLASEYREAFGGLQSDPGGSFARFKRIKRGLRVS